jgi:hypothetical protein
LFQVIYSSAGGFTWWTRLEGVAWPLLVLLFVCVGWWPCAAALAGMAAWQAWSRSKSQLHHTALSWRERLLLWWLCLGQPVLREWSRFKGMWQLRAAPGALAHLPDILPPIRPRKWSLPIKSMSWWSETGVGRDALLQELTRVLPANSRWDDGWRWFDVELYPDFPISAALISVTEYHGSGKQLTRVRVLLRVRRWLVLLLVTLLLARMWLGPWSHALWLTLVAIAFPWMMLRPLLRHLREAVSKCGLEK